MPEGHYWVMQIADVFTHIVHTLGSAWGTPGSKFLLVGPDWQGEKPEGFIEVIRLPTNYGGVFPRSFAARTPEARERAIAVQNQMGVYPLSQNEDGQKRYDCEAISRNHVFPPGVTAEMIAADPDVARPQWVVPTRFWQDVEKMLAANPTVGADDAAMAEQARSLVALHASDPAWAAVLGKAVLEADASLHASARYEAGGRRCRQRLAASVRRSGRGRSAARQDQAAGNTAVAGRHGRAGGGDDLRRAARRNHPLDQPGSGQTHRRLTLCHRPAELGHACNSR